MNDIHKNLSELGLLVDHFDIIHDIEESYDQYIYDSKYDRYLLDCFSFIASNPVGHNHPGLNTPEFEKKLLRVAKTKPSTSDLLTQEFAEFVQVFDRVLNKNKHFKYKFFVEGGSTAVENAIKIAFDWKMRKLHSQDILGVKAEDLEIGHFEKAFHGRSGYSLSITNTDPNKIKYFPKFNWLRFKPVLESSYLEEVEVDDVVLEIKSCKDNIAAVIIEPIQGEGGDRHFSLKFHQALRKITKECDILLIYDEIQTGVGLTGKTWAYEHYDIVPDLICFGKKAQVCGVMASKRLDEVKGHAFEESSRINSTFGGNLVDMVRCQRYLEIIEEEKLIENAEVIGKFLLDKLKRLSIRFPDLLSNPRGKGLMCSFDLPCKGARDLFIKDCLTQGIFLLGCGETSIRFRPSLNFKEDHVNIIEFGISKILKTYK